MSCLPLYRYSTHLRSFKELSELKNTQIVLNTKKSFGSALVLLLNARKLKESSKCLNIIENLRMKRKTSVFTSSLPLYSLNLLSQKLKGSGVFLTPEIINFSDILKKRVWKVEKEFESKILNVLKPRHIASLAAESASKYYNIKNEKVTDFVNHTLGAVVMINVGALNPFLVQDSELRCACTVLKKGVKEPSLSGLRTIVHTLKRTSKKLVIFRMFRILKLKEKESYIG
jgi:hypothetical protein